MASAPAPLTSPPRDLIDRTSAPARHKQLIVSAIPSGDAPSAADQGLSNGELLTRSYTVWYKKVKYQITVNKPVYPPFTSLSPDQQAQVNADMEALKGKLIADLNKSKIPAKETIQFHFVRDEGYLAYVPKENSDPAEIENRWTDDAYLTQHCGENQFYRETSETGKRIAKTFLIDDYRQISAELRDWDRPAERRIEPYEQTERPRTSAPNETRAAEEEGPKEAPPITEINQLIGGTSTLRIDFEAPPPKEQKIPTEFTNDLWTQIHNGNQQILLNLAEYNIPTDEVIDTIKQTLAHHHYDLVDRGAHLTLQLPNQLKGKGAELAEWIHREMRADQIDERNSALLRRSVAFPQDSASIKIEGVKSHVGTAHMRAGYANIDTLKDRLKEALQREGAPPVVVELLADATRAKLGVTIPCNIRDYNCTYSQALDAFFEVLEETGIQTQQTIRLLCPNDLLTGRFNRIDRLIESIRQKGPKLSAAQTAAKAQEAKRIQKGNVDSHVYKSSDTVNGRMRLSILKATGDRPEIRVTKEEITKELEEAKNENRAAQVILRGATNEPVQVFQEALDEFYAKNRNCPLEIELIIDPNTTDLFDEQLDKLIYHFNDQIIPLDYVDSGADYEGKIRLHQGPLTIVTTKKVKRADDMAAPRYPRFKGDLKTCVKADLADFKRSPKPVLLLDFRVGECEYAQTTDNEEIRSYDLREFHAEENPYEEIISALDHYTVPANGEIVLILPDAPKVKKAIRLPLPPRREQAMGGLRSLWNAAAQQLGY